VCKVVVEELLDKNTRNLLLIQTGRRSGQDVVNVARLFGGPAAPKNAKGKRIVLIEASSAQPEGTEKPHRRSHLRSRDFRRPFLGNTASL
jgi:hypothetical protein